MHPYLILSDSGTKFKNQLMDNMHQQCGIGCIFSALYHLQSNGKLEVFHKYLKPTLKKLCEKDPDNWDKIHQLSISQLPCDTTPCDSCSTILPSLSKRPWLTLSPIAGANVGILQWSCFWMSRPWITIPCPGHSWEDFGWKLIQTCPKDNKLHPSNSKVGNRVSFKNKEPAKWDLMWRAGNRIVHIECNRHYLHIENQATGKTRPCNVKDVVHKQPGKLWNDETMFGRAGKFINHPSDLPIIPLNISWNNIDKTLLLIKTPLFSLFCIGILTERDTECYRSVIFNAALKAYPTVHSWIIIAYISLRDLNRQQCMLNHQKTLTHQPMVKLQDQPLASEPHSVLFWMNFLT